KLDADHIGRSDQLECSGNDAIFAALRGNVAAEGLESDAFRFPSIHGSIFKAHYSIRHWVNAGRKDVCSASAHCCRMPEMLPTRSCATRVLASPLNAAFPPFWPTT